MRRTPFASLTPALPLSSASSLRDNLLPTGPSRYPCPRVDTPPQSLLSSLLEIYNKNMGIDSVWLDSVGTSSDFVHPTYKFSEGSEYVGDDQDWGGDEDYPEPVVEV